LWEAIEVGTCERYNKAMIGEADYRNVTSEVRTPRFVAFIDENNPHWRTVVASLVRLFSQTWEESISS
jgi:hypothetical protein